jgi:hypothetical protein
VRVDVTQYDLEPPFEVRLSEGSYCDSGVPDLSADGTAVTFAMKQLDGTATVQGNATISDVPTAAVVYTWVWGNLDVPGIYVAQWTVLFPGGRPESFPVRDKLYVVVHPYVGPDLDP